MNIYMEDLQYPYGVISDIKTFNVSNQNNALQMKLEPWYFINGLKANLILDITMNNESLKEAVKD